MTLDCALLATGECSTTFLQQGGFSKVVKENQNLLNVCSVPISSTGSCCLNVILCYHITYEAALQRI